MKRRALPLLALSLLAACASAPEPEPAVPGAARPAEAAVANAVKPPLATPPPEFPAVVVRLRRIDDRFVAEVIDVRGAEPDPRPLEGEARRDAVRRLESLLGDRAHVVDSGS